jgi:hypothetical protein
MSITQLLPQVSPAGADEIAACEYEAQLAHADALIADLVAENDLLHRRLVAANQAVHRAWQQQLRRAG